MFHFLKKFDIFGRDIPSFNINGKNTIQTIPGTIVSILIGLLTLSFGILKFEHLVRRKQPFINETSSPLIKGTSQKLSDGNLMMAFSLESFDTSAPLDDPRFNRWYAASYTIEEGIWTTSYSLLDKCTEADFEKFYQAENEETKQKVETLKALD